MMGPRSVRALVMLTRKDASGTNSLIFNHTLPMGVRSKVFRTFFKIRLHSIVTRAVKATPARCQGGLALSDLLPNQGYRRNLDAPPSISEGS
jgi:hypothetical protein